MYGKNKGGKKMVKEIEYTSLLDSWKDFNTQMTSQLMENMKEQQDEYETCKGSA